jgi:hypothetical protein
MDSTTLLSVIDAITQFGTAPYKAVPNRYWVLEKNLIHLYHLYLQLETESDSHPYPDFDKTTIGDIRKHVEAHFTDFGMYPTILDINTLNLSENHGIGDAIDDLTDIITDLLEIRWRLLHNSTRDGLWFFRFIFAQHTQQHVLDLLNYMKQKNE